MQNGKCRRQRFHAVAQHPSPIDPSSATNPTARAPRRASSLAWPGHLIDPHSDLSLGSSRIARDICDCDLSQGLVKCNIPSFPLFDGAAVLSRVSYVLITLLHLVSARLPFSSPYPYPSYSYSPTTGGPLRHPAGRSPTDILHPKAKEALLPHPGRAAISRGPHEYQPITATTHLELTDLRAVVVVPPPRRPSCDLAVFTTEARTLPPGRLIQRTCSCPCEAPSSTTPSLYPLVLLQHSQLLS